MNFKKLGNNYFIIRHGHSKANNQEIIISDPETGINNYGLSDIGIKQVFSTAEKLKDIRNLIIYSSDFKRTLETAKILEKILKPAEVRFTPLLRERFFGSYNGGSDKNYQNVWDKDIFDENNKDNFVESPKEVSSRVSSLIKELEINYSNQNILLVSHGDCLQIMETLFLNIPPSSHRSVEHLEVGEIRNIYKIQYS